ncbi:MAG: alkaline phosphatase family protein [Chloroflexi bacterium]|nr:alkaline phosphatase family protein [Chloroflexota bacterium]
MVSSTTRACVMVWDGLRPDLVSPEATPNLWQLAEQGVWFDRSYAVYPTLTRANSPAISTGCRPGAAGVPGNTFLLRGTDGSLTSHSSGDVRSLERLAEADGQPVLLVDTLADRVHAAGQKSVVVGSGSPGSAWLQHPRAIEAEDAVIADGVSAMKPFMQAVRARFGPLPRRDALPATQWTRYFTRIITEFVLPELTPTLLVFWHTDPDHTSHARGYFAAETVQSLRDADANLGAILSAYERLGMREATAFVVTSDHGGSTVTRRARAAQDLARVLREGAAAENGGSVFVYSSDAELVSAIRRFDYVGPIFTSNGRDGTFPLSMVGLSGPRAPDAVFSFTWSAEMVRGIVGTATGAESKLVMDHGSISPYDLRNTLVLQGPDFRSGWRSRVPVGNIDICPTLTHLLGLGPGSSMEGRVLWEALKTWQGADPEWTTTEEAQPYSARGRAWQQRIWFDHVGEFQYLTHGTIE